MPETYAAWVARDVIAATGPDAPAYLQGQLSQDVSGMAGGDSTWSWVLAPTGKIDALVRVTLAADTWILDTDAGWGDALLARLNRFRLRSKVDFESTGWRVLGLRGPAAMGAASPGGGTVAVADASWPGWPGVDLIGPDPAPPGRWRIAEAVEYEADRIAAGVPRMGAELTDKTIPAETGLVARTVSFTKGCYTGQELVARVDSRGSNVPRHLCRVAAGGPVEVGDELWIEGRAVGRVTSAAPAAAGGWVGLAYIRRGVEIPAAVRIGEGGPEAEVRELP